MFRYVRIVGLACCTVIFAIVLAVLSAQAASLRSPFGNWLTANGHGVIEIASCGEGLCGRIVGIDRAPADPMPTDVQGRPQCGLTIITADRPVTEGVWSGSVTDPRDGTRYRAELWVDDDGDLHLRGYLGIPLLGETQIWHHYAGQLTADCGLM